MYKQSARDLIDIVTRRKPQAQHVPDAPDALDPPEVEMWDKKKNKCRNTLVAIKNVHQYIQRCSHKTKSAQHMSQPKPSHILS